LPQISRHNVRLGCTWSIFENLKFTPSLIYRSTPENVRITDDLAGELRNPAEFNIFLLYNPWTHVDVFSEFRNVTNNHYALRGVLGPMPQETFHASAGVRWRY
jgi:hypothetical protein